MVTLGQLSEADAGALVAESVASFIDDLVQSGVDRDVASRATDEHMRRLIPEGVRTEGHRFRSIDDAGRRVGQLWFGPAQDSAGDFYLFEIDIHDDARGRGLGRMAMKVVIRELEQASVDRLGLHVFDSNSAAVALYESLGFETVDHGEGQREMWRQLRDGMVPRS
ncbi:hypothetical protein BH24ACT5_BH24ACT5_22370 [soil metagenome]